jgi:hypothetical protein
MPGPRECIKFLGPHLVIYSDRVGRLGAGAWVESEDVIMPVNDKGTICVLAPSVQAVLTAKLFSMSKKVFSF